jgi:hypothetical protein
VSDINGGFHFTFFDIDNENLTVIITGGGVKFLTIRRDSNAAKFAAKSYGLDDLFADGIKIVDLLAGSLCDIKYFAIRSSGDT